MKTKLTMLIMLFSMIAFGQANKFSDGDFSIRYGILFNGAVNQQITFARIVKSKWEIGTSVNFSYTHNNSTNFDTTSVIGLHNIRISVNEQYGYKQDVFNIGLSPFALYHFKTTNNLDIYAGPYVALSFGYSGPQVSTDVENGTDYYQDRISTQYYPVTWKAGGGAILGCQFFFYKNLAIGAQGSIGCTVGGSQGKSLYKDEIINSGAQNPVQGDIIDRQPVTLKTFSAGAALSGGVGLNLTFYFNKKVKKPVAPANP